MDTKSAKAKLDHVINIGRVEMYKPIQIAEVLRIARTSKEIDLADVETYRIKSRRWRDGVTYALFNKRSTSSVRYQDDVWNNSAVPPAAMVALGKANATDAVVEAYIYSFIIGKNKELAIAVSTVTSLKSVHQVEALLSTFDSPTLTSSADRLYEILAAAVFKTELSQTSYTISVDRPRGSTKEMSVDILVDLVASHPMPLVVERLGHTNAADAGLDMWTNFGVAVNVKRRLLTAQLLDQIVTDTPIGSLHIVCVDIDLPANTRLKKLRESGLRISITTQRDLMNSSRKLLARAPTSATFVKNLTEAFDKEFPMARTLEDFARERGYSSVLLTGLWKRRDVVSERQCSVQM